MSLVLIESEQPTALPRPTRQRWQPLRGGLLNLYKYDHEEFWFEDGHLLLRGNNGTGKSRVLALQLPFLLDGEVSPNRVEPDADPAKRMEWNLLMNRYEDRVGYTWLEFGRLTSEGESEYLTLGCGLSATQGQSGVGKWFFITSRRVGESLGLQAAGGQPLAKDRLREALGGEGELFGTAQAYRDAVDARLFGLGRHRYEALVGLLIQLRKPQLTRAFQEGVLSGALREALPPLPQRMVDEIAEAFRALEHDRAELESFRGAAAAIDRFLETYRRYVQVCVRRRSDQVRSTHTRYDDAQRAVRREEERLSQANAQLARVEQDLHERKDELQRASAEATALQESELWREAEALTNRKLKAEELAREARAAESEAARADSWLNECRRALEKAIAAVEEMAAAVHVAAGEAHRAAAEVSLERQHLLIAESLRTAVARHQRPTEASELLEKALSERQRAIAVLRKLLLALQGTRRELEEKTSDWTNRASELEQAVGEERDQRALWEAARDSLLGATERWHGSLRFLDPGPWTEIEEGLVSWTANANGPFPLRGRVEKCHATFLDRIKAQKADKLHSLSELKRSVGVLQAERARLAAGEHTPPVAPPTRGAMARAPGRPGSPLWRVCDFHDSVPAPVRAGIEAALEASGLLDAWVTEDGLILPESLHDTVLSAGDPLPEGTARLSEWLKPSVDPKDADACVLGEAAVARVLGSIGGREGASVHWVAPEGTYRLGPLSGRWSKPAAAHLGHAAREQARRAALARVEEELARMSQQEDQLDSEIRDLDVSEAGARQEAAGAPTGEELRARAMQLDYAAQLVIARRQKTLEAEARVQHAREKSDAADRALAQTANDLGLSAWAQRIAELEDRTGAFRSLSLRLLQAGAEEFAQRQEGARAERETAQAQEQKGAALTRLERVRREAGEALGTYEALDRAKGASLAELARQLEDAKRRKEQAQTALERLVEERREHDAARIRAEDGIRAAQEGLQRETDERQEAMIALWKVAGIGFLVLVDGALKQEETASPWTPTRALEIARKLESLLENVEHGESAWERLGAQIQARFQALMSELGHSGLFHPEASVIHDVFHVQVGFQNRRVGVDELRIVLDAEVLQRQTLLDQRERTLLENHLLGEVATHLHDRLQAAEKWVVDINEELQKCPTSTGMALRFVWEPNLDGPSGLLGARRLLMRNQATWSPEQRATVGSFLKEQIDRARAADPASTWQEHLSIAFDYRCWHTFVIQRHQDGRWQRLTKQTHGTGSGGEKAIALTLPQFAAAAAHYRSAVPTAPRLILLDEAFVGIDSDMRSKSMALLATFDLDFVMTSEREWGCYGTLPGVAICQLTSQPGIDAVHVSRWVWNGKTRMPADVVLGPLASRTPRAET